MENNRLDTHQKAVQINLDNTKYGTFAEIGAGQEVARWFFRVGGAAGTIAKSISAYDMTVSDAIYGAAGRYVSRQRLETMLDYEYRPDERTPRRQARREHAVLRLRRHRRRQELHPQGQLARLDGHPVPAPPGAEPSQIILHVSLLDRETTLQQEAVGILGRQPDPRRALRGRRRRS